MTHLESQTPCTFKECVWYSSTWVQSIMGNQQLYESRVLFHSVHPECVKTFPSCETWHDGLGSAHLKNCFGKPRQKKSCRNALNCIYILANVLNGQWSLSWTISRSDCTSNPWSWCKTSWYFWRAAFDMLLMMASSWNASEVFFLPTINRTILLWVPEFLYVLTPSIHYLPALILSRVAGGWSLSQLTT